MIEYTPETGSTNADLADRLRAGGQVPEGHWLVADRQSAGRGRQGREWQDGAGNFMGSTVVHLAFGDPPPGTLALLTGLAVCEVLVPLLPADNPPVLKWPNDVLSGKAKLAGILLEQQGTAVIVGIGVNLAQAPKLPDRETVAVANLGATPDRNRFADALVRQFALELERWRAYGVDPVVNRWLARGHPLGTPLATEGLLGTFAGLTPDGALQLRLADGSSRTIHAGEVNLAD